MHDHFVSVLVLSCAPGYEGNPTVVGGTCYKVGRCFSGIPMLFSPKTISVFFMPFIVSGNFSRCNSAGSISQKITADGVVECACKVQ